MSGKPMDLTGRVFGRLTAKRVTPERISKSPVWECACSCGRDHLATSRNLLQGGTKSCGCLRIETSRAAALDKEHGFGKSRQIAIRKLIGRMSSQATDAYIQRVEAEAAGAFDEVDELLAEFGL